MNPIKAGRRLRVLVGGTLVASLVLSAFATLRVAESVIDVGVDKEGEEPPVLVWAGQRLPMERISPQYSPALRSFEIVATGEKHAAAKSSEVWISGLAEESRLVQVPPGCWQSKWDWLVADSGGKSCALRWEAPSHLSKVTLRAHSWSGKARLPAASGEQTLDLYSEVEKTIDVPLAAVRALTRFHCKIPRHALATLRLENAPPDELWRLYVGTLVPRIFSGKGAFSKTPFGLVEAGWRPAIEGGSIDLSRLAPAEAGGAATFGALSVIFALLLILIQAAVWLLARGARALLAPTGHGTLAPFRWRHFLGFQVPLLAVWLMVLAAFFPGAMTSDSTDQWGQMHGGRLSDAHPALHTLTIKALLLVWDSPAIVGVFQSVALSAVLAYAFTLLLRARVPVPVILVGWVLTLVSPLNANMAIILWKDTIYAALVLLLSALLAHQVLEEKGRMGRWVGVGLVIGLIPLYRHNGLVLLAGLPPLLLVLFWREWKRVAVSVACAALVFAGVKLVLYPAFQVAPLGSLAHWDYTVQISALLADDVPLSNEEYAFLEKVRSLEDRWAYSPRTNVPTIFSDRFDQAFARKEVASYRHLRDDLIRRYPLLFARHKARIADFVYLPRLEESYFPTLSIAPNSFGIAPSPLWAPGNRLFRRLFEWSTSIAVNWLLWRSAIHLYVSLFALVAVVWRLRDLRMVAPYLPVLLNSLGLLLAAPAQDFRYQFPLTLAAAFLVGLAFCKRPPQPAVAEETVPSC